MKEFGLVADAGGTNVRFALVDLDPAVKLSLISPQKFRSADFARIEDAAQQYLDGQNLASPPRRAVIAVAGPVKDDSIRMTNLGWQFSAGDLVKALRVGDAHLLNDFGAIAIAISALGAGDLRDVGSSSAMHSAEPATGAIVGPGTGLGVGGYVRAMGRIVPLVTEGGHMDFAPSDVVESEVLGFLRRRYEHVSAERILSGPGLVNLYEALAAAEGRAAERPDAHAITSTAMAEPDSFAATVVSRFCAILGSFAGNVALVLGARDGLYLAGGILPAIADFLTQSPFRARFEAKGRFRPYLTEIPTKLIVQDYAGLIGAARLARGEA